MTTLRQLEYVVAVADLLSFRAAAEHCYVTQPALSAQVKQLETRLGVRLFERDRRGVMITAAGTEVVRRARDILASTRDLEEAARALRGPLRGDLRLGVIPTIAPYLLPRALSAVREAYSDLRLLLTEDLTPRLVTQVTEGDLDLALLALEADLGDLEGHALARDEFLLAVAAGHRLASRRSVSEKDVARHELLLLEDGHCLRTQALAYCGSIGASEAEDVRATSLSTLLQMVAGGTWATLVPALSATALGGPGSGIVLIPFRRNPPARTIGLAWRRTSPQGAAFRELGEVLARQLPE